MTRSLTSDSFQDILMRINIYVKLNVSYVSVKFSLMLALRLTHFICQVFHMKYK